MDNHFASRNPSSQQNRKPYSLAIGLARSFRLLTRYQVSSLPFLFRARLMVIQRWRGELSQSSSRPRLRRRGLPSNRIGLSLTHSPREKTLTPPLTRMTELIFRSSSKANSSSSGNPRSAESRMRRGLTD